MSKKLKLLIKMSKSSKWRLLSNSLKQSLLLWSKRKSFCLRGWTVAGCLKANVCVSVTLAWKNLLFCHEISDTQNFSPSSIIRSKHHDTSAGFKQHLSIVSHHANISISCCCVRRFCAFIRCLSVSAGPSIGSLFHMADDLGRAMESLVSVMTDEQSAEQHEALPFWPPHPPTCRMLF